MRVGTHDRQAALTLGNAPACTEQHAEWHRVDERRLRQVDDDMAPAAVDPARECVATLGRGMAVGLTRNGDDDGAGRPPSDDREALVVSEIGRHATGTVPPSPGAPNIPARSAQRPTARWSSALLIFERPLTPLRRASS